MSPAGILTAELIPDSNHTLRIYPINENTEGSYTFYILVEDFAQPTKNSEAFGPFVLNIAKSESIEETMEWVPLFMSDLTSQEFEYDEDSALNVFEI